MRGKRSGRQGDNNKERKEQDGRICVVFEIRGG